MSISILNKIRHKPLLIDTIFSYAQSRPYIFPYLINHDPLLKKNLKKTVEPMKLKNKLEDKINDNICKFVTYRLMFDLELNTKDIKEMEINKYVKKTGQISMISVYSDRLYNKFQEIELNYFKINIPKNKILEYWPTGEHLTSFIKDYIFDKKDITLFYLPLNYLKEESDEFENFKWSSEKIYNDSYYIQMLNEGKNKNKQNLSLVCVFDEKKYYNSPMQITYEHIKQLTIYCDDVEDFQNFFDNFYKYIIGIKHRENIEKITFCHHELVEGKNILEYFVEGYKSFIQKMGEINLNFFSLEEVEFQDKDIMNQVDKLKVRYYMNKIFGSSTWCKMVNINYHDIENIFDLKDKDKLKFVRKINQFKHEFNNNCKGLFFNLENNSLFQKKVIHFFQEYIAPSPNIDIIIINNFGKENCDEEVYKNIKQSKKIKLTKIKQIIYDYNLFKEKDLMPEKTDDIKLFINNTFDYGNLLYYEAYDINKNLIYFNICKKLEIYEIQRVFQTVENIFIFKLIFEMIEIKIEKDKNNIYIINYGQKSKEYLYYIPIDYFVSFIESYKSMNITINGFEIEDSFIKYFKSKGIILNIIKVKETSDIALFNIRNKVGKEDNGNNTFNSNLNKIPKSLSFINFDSEILDIKVADLLKDGFKGIYGKNLKILTFNIIYRASLDGSQVSDFWDYTRRYKCKLLLVKHNNHQIIGFFKENWDKKYDASFAFNINKGIIEHNPDTTFTNETIKVKGFFCAQKYFFVKRNNNIIGNYREAEVFEVIF